MSRVVYCFTIKFISVLNCYLRGLQKQLNTINIPCQQLTTGCKNLTSYKMMHYRKGKNVETEMKKEDLDFKDCMPNGQTDFLWMHVKGGTKVNNVVTFAKNALDKGEYRTLVWSGAGGGLVKVVSCAEIIKRTHPLYQVTRMCYTNIEEHWLPQIEGLDELVVNRQIPCLHILMSLDEIDDKVPSLQKPNTKPPLLDRVNDASTSSNSRGSSRGRGGFTQQRYQNRNQQGEQNSAEHYKNQRQRNNYKKKNQKQQTQNNASNNSEQESRLSSPKLKEQSDASTSKQQPSTEHAQAENERMET